MMKFMIKGFQTNSVEKVIELVENAGGSRERITWCVGSKMFRKVENAEKYANGQQIAAVMY